MYSCLISCGNGESNVPQSFTSASSLQSAAAICVGKFSRSASSCVQFNIESVQETTLTKRPLLGRIKNNLPKLVCDQFSLSWRDILAKFLIMCQSYFTLYSSNIYCGFIHCALPKIHFCVCWSSLLSFSASLTLSQTLHEKPWQQRHFFLCLLGTQSIRHNIEK